MGDETLTLNIDDIKLKGVYVGDRVPNIVAESLDGASFDLSKFRGKIVLIDFWATWCSPCIAEIPNLRKLHEKYGRGGEDFVIVSVSMDNAAKTARKFVAKKDMPWTQVWADGVFKSDAAKDYNVTGIPAMFLVGPDGKLIAKNVRGKELSREVRTAVGKLDNLRTAKAEGEE